MLSITRQNVNDRISNRADNVVSGLVIGLRRYLHPVCSLLGQLQHRQTRQMLKQLSQVVGSATRSHRPEPVLAFVATPITWQSTSDTERSWTERSIGLTHICD